MEKRKISKSKKSSYVDLMTHSCSEFISQQLGKLDAATSFMYLFRRFGTPAYDNSHEYKILYDYRLQHKDLHLIISASYHEFVDIWIYIPKKWAKVYWQQQKQFARSIYEKNKDIPYAPYSMRLDSFPLTKSENEKYWKLVDEAAKTYFSSDDYAFIIQHQKAEYGTPELDRFRKLWQPFQKKLCENFRSRLSKEEIERLNEHYPPLSKISDLQEQVLEIVRELRRGYYVRDVPFNILGYESATNKITEFEHGQNEED